LTARANSLTVRSDILGRTTKQLYASKTWTLIGYIVDPVILKLVHPLAREIGARWVWRRGRRYLVYMKLDPEKVA